MSNRTWCWQFCDDVQYDKCLIDKWQMIYTIAPKHDYDNSLQTRDYHKQQTILLTILRGFSIWQMYGWCYTPHLHYFDIYSRNTYWFPITLYNPPVLSVLYYGNLRQILYINWNSILSLNKHYLKKKILSYGNQILNSKLITTCSDSQ